MLERTVIVEFESVEMVKAAYETDVYREALSAMIRGVERDFRILAGLIPIDTKECLGALKSFSTHKSAFRYLLPHGRLSASAIIDAKSPCRDKWFLAVNR